MVNAEVMKPLCIMAEIEAYFEKHLRNYTVIGVCQDRDVSYIYKVFAKKKNNPYEHMGIGSYAVWTCWNTETKSLNHGHYDLNRETANKVFNE